MDMVKLCSECDRFESCIELCDEVEEIVNKDYVSQTEYLITSQPLNSLENLYDSSDVWNRVNIEKRRLKYLILKLTEDGKTTSEIAYQLPCSTSYIRRIRRRYFKKKRRNK